MMALVRAEKCHFQHFTRHNKAFFCPLPSSFVLSETMIFFSGIMDKSIFQIVLRILYQIAKESPRVFSPPIIDVFLLQIIRSKRLLHQRGPNHSSPLGCSSTQGDGIDKVPVYQYTGAQKIDTAIREKGRYQKLHHQQSSYYCILIFHIYLGKHWYILLDRNIDNLKLFKRNQIASSRTETCWEKFD